MKTNNAGMYETLPQRTKMLLGLCCLFFALRGVADVGIAWSMGMPLNYLVGLVMLVPVAVYFGNRDKFASAGVYVGIGRAVISGFILAVNNVNVAEVLVQDLSTPGNIRVFWWLVGILPLVVGVYCLTVAEFMDKRARMQGNEDQEKARPDA